MTRIGILGYGNLGRGVELAIRQNPDLTLEAVLTRRDPASVQLQTPGVPVIPVEQAETLRDRVDVLVICGGSATDLPKQTPAFARLFNVVDSFDTHHDIPIHFARVDQAARETGHTAVISAGWDPGMFSLNRLYSSAILPDGKDYTFWGRGVSQGHSDAIRRIDGVLDARQYTVPVERAVERVRSGENPELTTREKHRRECYVVAAEDADTERIAREIVTMPNYFADYDTTVTFITMDEMKKNHAGLPHGGFVLRGGKTANASHLIEYKLTLGSNPEFTGSVLAATARAVARLAAEGKTGAHTLFDLPPAYLSPKTAEELRATML